jgi:hypothetical protein
MKLRRLPYLTAAIAVFVLGLAAWSVRPAHADDASLKRAQEAFDQAQVDYLQGNFDAAADPSSSTTSAPATT